MEYGLFGRTGYSGYDQRLEKIQKLIELPVNFFLGVEAIMKILVAIKQIAQLEENIELTAGGRDVVADFCTYGLNEWDD